MIRLVPYDKAHLDLLDLTEVDQGRYGPVGPFLSNPLAEHGICFTAISEGRILVVGGILITTLHTGFGWTMVSRYAALRPLEVVRVVKKQLEDMMTDLRLHRIETANLKQAEEHHRWCKLLGFEEEGPLRHYDDQGRDYIRFAKFMGV